MTARAWFVALAGLGCMAMTAAGEEIDYTRNRQDPFYLDYESESVKDIYLLLQQAEEAMRAEAWPESARLFRRLNELDPTIPFYVYSLVYIAYQTSDWEGVVRLSDGRTFDPVENEVAMLRGGALIHLQRYEEAAAVFASVLERDPSNSNALRGMATACLGAERYQDAAAHFRKLMEVEPEAPDAVKGLEVALVGVDIAERGIPPSQLASSHFMMGERDQAMEILLVEINRRPFSAALHRQAGRYYADMQMLEQSEQHLLDAERLSPNDPRILNDLGALAMRKQEDERAFRYFQRAIARNPRYAMAYRNLARLHRVRGEWRQSAEMAAKAIDLEPDATPARLLAAYGCYRAQDFERALAFLAPAMAREEEAVDVWIIAAMCSHLLGRTDQAADYYRKALSFDGELVVALNNVADIALSKTNATLAEMREAADFAKKASLLTSNRNEKVEQTYQEAARRAETMSWKKWVSEEYWRPPNP